jgi:hypothetical protein
MRETDAGDRGDFAEVFDNDNLIDLMGVMD